MSEKKRPPLPPPQEAPDDKGFGKNIRDDFTAVCDDRPIPPPPPDPTPPSDEKGGDDDS